ncbi:MAG: DUF393 domain-containing protein [Rhodospirillales bacterium]|nr:DUF393 domain-containing protein [Rhodospirillales bacterium]
MMPSQSNTEHHTATAYYDGACPLCAREINFYRRQKGADQVSWVDISVMDCVNIAPDLPRKAALARFTMRDFDGNLVSGSRAFISVWKRLPHFRWLAIIFSIQPLAWLLEKAYGLFLKTRPRLQALALRREMGRRQK